MDTRIWGPHMWEFLHTVSFNYPETPTQQDKKDMISFFHAAARILPCEKCQVHFQKLLQTDPIEAHVESREVLSRWLVHAHNQVNTRIHKPSMDYDFVRDKYEQMRGTCIKGQMSCPVQSTPPTNKHHMAVCILLSIAVIAMVSAVIYVYKQKKTSISFHL